MPREDLMMWGDYNRLAEQERMRQRGMAESYLREGPSIGNLYNAAMAFWNSLPIVGINSTDVNPNINMGIADFGGGPSKTLSTFLKLSAAGKAQNAKSLMVRRANAAARKAAEEAKKASIQQIDIDDPFHSLRVRNVYDNYVANPAERAAALDYIQDLKLSNQYDLFFVNNPGYKIKTKVEPGVSEDWLYPEEVMVRHGLKKPVVNKPRSTTQVLQKPIVPRKTQQQRSSEYYLEKVEDKNQGVFKRLRKSFNAQRTLSDGDMRHVNSGRTSMAKIRLADLNIKNYSSSALKDYDKLRLKAAKKGYNTDQMMSLPEIKNFLRNLIENEGHRF